MVKFISNNSNIAPNLAFASAKEDSRVLISILISKVSSGVSKEGPVCPMAFFLLRSIAATITAFDSEADNTNELSMTGAGAGTGRLIIAGGALVAAAAIGGGDTAAGKLYGTNALYGC